MSITDFLIPESPLLPEATPPLALGLPANQATLTRQVASPQLAPYLNAFPDVGAAYQQLAQNRVNVQGVAPWTNTQAQHAIQAAGQHAPVTAPPSAPFLSNLSSDAQTLMQSLSPPTLIKGLLSELTQVGTAAKLGEQIAKPTSNPLEWIGNLAQAPGLRLIPGSFIASQFGTGGAGVSGLTEHPLFSALDVLPYASKAAELSGVVKEARRVADIQAETARDAGLSMAPTRIRPISTFLRNVQPGAEGGFITDEAGKTLGTSAGAISGAQDITAPALQPNMFGQLVQNARDVGGQTLPGEWINKTFGQQARDTARTFNRAESDMNTRPLDQAENETQAVLIHARDEARAIQSKYADMPAADRAEVTDVVRLHGTTSPEYDALSPEQRAFAEATRAESEAIKTLRVDNGELTPIPYAHGTEIFDNDSAAKILKARDVAMSNVQLILDHYRGQGTYATDEATLARLPEYAANSELQANLTRLQSAVDQYDWTGARDAVADIKATVPPGPFTPLPFTQARTTLRRAASADLGIGWAGKNIVAPATVMPRLREDLSQRVQEMTRTGIPEPSIAPGFNADYVKLNPELAMQEAIHGQYSNILDPEALRQLQDSVQSTWATLRAQGFDPQFVHSVHPTVAMRPPRILDYTPSLSQLKTRAWDAAGDVNDLSISLTHQAAEGLSREFSQQAISQLTRDKAINGAVLQAQLTPHIQPLLDANPLLSPKAAMDALIKRSGLTKFDPDSFLNNKTTSFVSPENDLYLPKETVAVLNELKSPQVGLGSLMAAPMRLFRMSVLTLRPQWYMGNAFSGSILAAGQAEGASFLTMMKHAKAAWEIAKNPTVGHVVESFRTPEAINFASREWRAMAPLDTGLQAEREFLVGLKPTAGVATGLMRDFKGGSKLYEFAQQMEERRAARGTQPFFAKLQEKGGQFNSLADNFWNILSTLNEYDRKVSAGAERGVAIQSAIEKSRSVFETWDTLTPGERGIVKSIFPFYGFTRSVLKYTLQYPSTHPTRLAILSSLAKSEQADIDSGLPAQLRALMYFGDTNSDGTVKALSVGSLNPFQDIGSYASMLGFISGGQGDLSAITRNVNPALSTMLDALGVDPSRGQGQLYPDLYYDPTTGRLAVKSGNLLQQFTTNLVPQSEILYTIAGANAQFNSTLRSNPDAAGRMMLSSMGVPILTRDINLPAERMKSEVVRLNQQKLDLTQALKTGDMSLAEKWPGLKMALATLAKMPEAERAKYQLQPRATVPEAIKSGAT